jgi:hypothetical protein
LDLDGGGTEGSLSFPLTSNGCAVVVDSPAEFVLVEDGFDGPLLIAE